MSVEIREASAADRSDVTTLALGRCPDTEPWMIDLLFTDSLAFDAFVVAVDGDEVVGFGYSGNIPGTPAPQRSTYVAVAATHDDAGLGSRIYRHCRAAHDESVTDLRSRVFDDDPRSLAIAKHWGFEVSSGPSPAGSSWSTSPLRCRRTASRSMRPTTWRSPTTTRWRRCSRRARPTPRRATTT